MMGFVKIKKKEIILFYILIPAFLLLVFFSPLNELFILQKSNPNIISIYFSSYAHFTIQHLERNLIGYFLFISILLIFRTDRKKYYTNIFMIFGLLPFLLSGYSILHSPTGRSMGFSGIDAALCGYFSYTFIMFSTEILDLKLKKVDILSILCLILLINLFVTTMNYKLNGYFISYTYISLLLFFIGVLLINVRKRIKREILKEKFQNKIKGIILIFVSIYFAILISFSTFFPTDVISGSLAVGIIVHYLGYCFGLFTPLLSDIRH
jgi:hypothetical protein